MKNKKVLLILLVIASLTGLTGCFNTSVDESHLPWAKPAAWEGKNPGMGF